MIYTLTFNPALDYAIDVKEMHLGSVNRVNNEHIYLGGKGINVSTILHRLGFETKILGFVAGFTGDEFQRHVSIPHEFIEVSGMTRINIKIRSEEETEVNGVGPTITDNDLEKLYELLETLKKDDVLVLSGSIPKSLPSSTYKNILKRIDPSILTIVDATGELLTETLSYHPFLIKPNIQEIEEIYHVKINSTQELVRYAVDLQMKGAKNVLVSMAGDGSLLLDEHGDIHQLGTCKGTVKNSVGAGDSMVAGFIAGYLNTKSYKEALMLGTACGGATAFSDDLADKDMIDTMYQQLKENL